MNQYYTLQDIAHIDHIMKTLRDERHYVLHEEYVDELIGDIRAEFTVNVVPVYSRRRNEFDNMVSTTALLDTLTEVRDHMLAHMLATESSDTDESESQ